MSEKTLQAAVGSSAELGQVPGRAAFEAEMAKRGYHTPPALYRDGSYRDTCYATGWEMWQAAVAAERERCGVLLIQRDSLRDALRKVLDAHDAEAKAYMSWQNARENFSLSSHEAEQHERAMLAASDAEREARVLLLTLRA